MTSLFQKCLSLPVNASQESPGDLHEVLLFVTVYDRLTWGHKLISRSSQHVFLSSHTLGDMFDSIPCPSNEMPQCQADGTWSDGIANTGAVILLEDTAYGDGQSEHDYSESVVFCRTTLLASC